MESMQSKAIKTLAKLFKINNIWMKQGQELKNSLHKKQEDIGLPTKKMFKNYNIQINVQYEHPIYLLHSQVNPAKKTVLYLPGGGFVLPISPLHWSFIDNMIKEANVNVIVPLYPLAPNHTINDIMMYLLTIYQNIISNKEELVIMGDSAGGTIALSFIQLLKKQQLPFPKEVIAISPLVDFELKNPEILTVQKLDPISASPALKDIGQWIAGDYSLSDALLSPINGNFAQTTNITIFSGTADITNPDTRKMIDHAPEHFNYYEYPGMMHVFPLFPLPEAKKAKQQILALLK
ncbi:alpha/beta hydrolase [Niallia nealsonii]|uniref:Alpha/beta hydrolase fold-3 domain-containing protein n=1 Tax=Niallia nealsonii TaxID=115979 RepID=A0A2N0Z010_9BACI|nr:alpha/beta hydrolase [Niallia nealsonii]PKG22850.1 hypothetical protein CWS01_14275 [Niallia nealsonii]